MAVITELVTKFTFRGTLKPLEVFNAEMGKSVKLVTASLATIGAAALGLGYLTIRTLENAQAQKRLSVETGISIEKIQELGYAASVSGSSAQSLESSLVSLTGKIGQAAQTGSADFARLGISVRDSFGNVKQADQIIQEVATRFKELNLSLPQKQSIASSLGIDISLLNLLSKSNVEIDKLHAKARAFGIVTKEQAEKVENFNNSITTLKFGMGSLQTQIAIGLSPHIQEITELFTGWLVKNKDLIKNGIEKTFDIIEAIGKSIKRLATFVNDIVTATVGWKAALIGLGVILAVTLSPVYLITAGIAAALLVVDDLIVAFKGGKSVIREFFLEFFDLDIVPILKEIVAVFNELLTIVNKLGAFKFGILPGFAKLIYDQFKARKKDIDSLEDKSIPGPLETRSPAFDLIPNMSNVKPVSNNNQITQNVKIDIKSTDPQAAGKAVSDGLQNQLQSAEAQINRGGR